MAIKWEATRAEADTMRKIAERAIRNGIVSAKEKTDIWMDIEATHCNGCPLRLDDLLAADDFNFNHDVAGIHGHLDRTTGELGDCFWPRFARPEGR